MSVITDLIDENSSCNARIAELEARIVWLECEAQVNAAPVSEAKEKGVVQWPNADEIMQMAFEEGQPADDASGYYFELEEFDLFIERLMSEVARLNAAPAQQVSVPVACSCGREYPANSYSAGFISGSGMCEECDAAMPPKDIPQMVSVPDISAMARILADRNADACNVNREDNWAIYGQDYIDDVTAMLAASPAAPAADAGLSLAEWTKDAEDWGGALNDAGWLFLSELNEDPQKSALIFNNCKGPLRAAIMKYAEIVAAHSAQEAV